MILITAVVAICAGLVFGVSDASLSTDESSCQAKMTAFPLDPGSECCTHVSANTSVAGGQSVAHIYKNPWAARINYNMKRATKNPLLCSGTLISGKYVLTAACCITGKVMDYGTPTKVRLGDYDSNHEGPDCVPVEGAAEVCTEGAISIDIETITPHPNYDPIKITHDIGLIRLKETAPYTDFIRPICLPTTNPEINPPDHSLYAVSWFKDNVKIVYEVPFVNQEKCKPIYSFRHPYILGQGQLCAGGIEGMDPCKGDSGGPLVYENKEGLAELTGLGSFGPIPCGLKDVPSVYTNVFEYLDWIKTIIAA